jgi:hypothetical protein
MEMLACLSLVYLGSSPFAIKRFRALAAADRARMTAAASSAGAGNPSNPERARAG